MTHSLEIPMPPSSLPPLIMCTHYLPLSLRGSILYLPARLLVLIRTLLLLLINTRKKGRNLLKKEKGKKGEKKKKAHPDATIMSLRFHIHKKRKNCSNLKCQLN